MGNFIRNLGLPELIIIGLVIVWIVGQRKAKDIGKSLGESTKEFKKVKKEANEALTEAKKELE